MKLNRTMEERQETPSTLVCNEARCLRWSSKSSDRQIWLSQPENWAQQRTSYSPWFDHFYRDSFLARMLFLQLFWLILRCLWDQLTCRAEGVSKTSSRLSSAPLLGMPDAEHPSLKLGSNYLPEIMLRSGHLHYFHVKSLSGLLISVYKPYLLISQEDRKVAGNFLRAQTPVPHKTLHVSIRSDTNMVSTAHHSDALRCLSGARFPL